MSSTRLFRRCGSAVSVALLAAATAAVPAQAAPEATGAQHLPNLVVAAANVDRATVTEGAVLTVTHTVRNTGRAGAGKSRSRYYLTKNAAASLRDRKASSTNPRTSPTDILLSGGSVVPALGAGKSSKQLRTKVTVPVGTAAGRYAVLACAEDSGAVRESNEADNCRVADTVKVATAPGTSGLTLAEFADSYTWSDPNSDLTYLRYFCSATVAPKHYTPSAALAATKKYLTDKAGADALTKIARSGFADTAVEAQELAATAIANGSPGLALAAELRAHQLEPKIATHLVNAAAIAESVGLPNEALGLLDGAAPLDFRRPAMGLSEQAIVDVVRGNALELTGRSDAAKALFSAARQAEPLMREADAGLANVTGCANPDAVAKAYVAAARTRTPDPKDAVIDPGHVPPVKPRLDLSHGKVTTLRTLPDATTPAHGVTQWPVYKSIEDGFFTEIQHHIDEENQLQSQLNAENQTISIAQRRRRDGIMTLAYGFDTTSKKVLADQTTVNHLIDELTRAKEGFWGGGTGEAPYKYKELSDAADAACTGAQDYQTCYDTTLRSTCVPALAAAHGNWWQLMGELHAAAAKWLADTSRGMSAYAANLADPYAHRRVLLAVEELEQEEYALVVQQADFWTHYELEFSDHCVDSSDPGQPGTPPVPGTADSAGPCPQLLHGINVSFKLAGASIKANCETIKASLSTDVEPYLNLFLDVTYTTRTGSISAVAGVKGGGKVGGIVDAGFKSGFYLTTNGQGEISDVGWRVGPSVSVGKGPINVGSWKDEIDLSFVPGMTTGPE